MTHQKYRIGLIINQKTLLSELTDICDKLNDSGVCEIPVVIVIESKYAKAITPEIKIRKLDRVLLLMYLQINKALRRSNSDKYAKDEIKNVLQNVDIIVADKLNDFEIKSKKQEYNLDILVDLNSYDTPNKLANFSKHGILQAVSVIPEKNIVAPLFWFMLSEDPTLEIKLIVQKDYNTDITIKNAFISPYTKSYTEFSQYFQKKVNSLIVKEIERLHKIKNGINVGTETVANFTVSSEELVYKPSILIKHIYHIIKKNLQQKLTKQQWLILYDQSELLQPLNKMKKMLPPNDRHWTDPFILRGENSSYIFFEEQLQDDSPGYISVIEVNGSQESLKSKVVIKEDFHLSYPFLLNYNGEYFIIPESAEDHSIRIYRCIEFPLKWKFEKKLIENIDAMDSNLFYYNNTWWLFTSIRTHKDFNTAEELNLFYNESELLTGKWNPHPLNPIISDIRRARAAGRIFEYDDKIYRPSQDCSKYYGRGVNFYQITKLSKTEYAEEYNTSFIQGDKNGFFGSHTYNHSNGMTVIDARRQIMKKPSFTITRN